MYTVDSSLWLGGGQQLVSVRVDRELNAELLYSQRHCLSERHYKQIDISIIRMQVLLPDWT